MFVLFIFFLCHSAHYWCCFHIVPLAYQRSATDFRCIPSSLTHRTLIRCRLQLEIFSRFLFLSNSFSNKNLFFPEFLRQHDVFITSERCGSIENITTTWGKSSLQSFRLILYKYENYEMEHNMSYRYHNGLTSFSRSEIRVFTSPDPLFSRKFRRFPSSSSSSVTISCNDFDIE